MKGGFRPNSGRKKGSIPWNKGRPMSEESRRKVAESKKGAIAWNKGKNMSDSMRQKMLGNTNGKGNKGRIFKESTIEKMRLARIGKTSPNKGKAMSEQQKEKIRQSKLGKFHTDELKEKNRQGQYKRYIKIYPNYIIATRNKRIAENGGFHSEKEWIELKEKHKFICANPFCKKQEPAIKLTRDHIIPLLLGGSNTIENIQPLCMQCNRKKHIQTIRY